MADMARGQRPNGGTAKKNELVADVSHCYSFDASQLDRETLAGFAANMPRVRAQEMLAEGDFDPTDYEGIYRVTLAATGNIESANRARTQAMKALVKQRTETKS